MCVGWRGCSRLGNSKCKGAEGRRETEEAGGGVRLRRCVLGARVRWRAWAVLRGLGGHGERLELDSKYGGKPLEGFLFLATLRGMWDLSSPARARTCTPCIGGAES